MKVAVKDLRNSQISGWGTTVCRFYSGMHRLLQGLNRCLIFVVLITVASSVPACGNGGGVGASDDPVDFLVNRIHTSYFYDPNEGILLMNENPEDGYYTMKVGSNMETHFATTKIYDIPSDFSKIININLFGGFDVEIWPNAPVDRLMCGENVFRLDDLASEADLKRAKPLTVRVGREHPGKAYPAYFLDEKDRRILWIDQGNGYRLAWLETTSPDYRTACDARVSSSDFEVMYHHGFPEWMSEEACRNIRLSYRDLIKEEWGGKPDAVLVFTLDPDKWVQRGKMFDPDKLVERITIRNLPGVMRGGGRLDEASGDVLHVEARE